MGKGGAGWDQYHGVPPPLPLLLQTCSTVCHHHCTSTLLLTHILQCAIQMRIIFSVHFRWRSVVPLPVLPSPSPRRPSIVEGGGTRCDKGSWQSYLFWINVRICRPRRSIVGGANVTSGAILSSNTNAQLSANNSLWLNTKKVGFVFIETT